jgi:transcriptional regulator with XRE-family HTH domain
MSRPKQQETVARIDAAVGVAIRRYRLARKMSQEQLAAALGITFQQIQKYEAGTNSIATGSLAMLCEIFQVTPNDLYCSRFKGSPMADFPAISDDAMKVASAFDKLPVHVARAVCRLVQDLIDA